jgi:hypothetical protein
MTFSDFLLAVKYRPTFVSGAERYGQALFNTLHQHRPTLAEKMRASNIDPFHAEDSSDIRVYAALSFIRTNW